MTKRDTHVGRFHDKVAVVTGAARGQGRAHCLALAREGADIVALDLERQIATVPYDMTVEGDLDEVVRLVTDTGGRAIACRADVRSGEQLAAAVDRAVATFGRIDVLVANAGIWGLAPLHEMTREAWQDVIDVNLTGVWESIKAVAPVMLRQQAGAMVLTSSANGLEGAVNYAHYVAAKHGVLGLMKAAALEYGRHDVRVNAVCPGAIDTKMNDNPGGYELSTGRSDATREDSLRAAHHWSVLARRGMLAPESVSAAVLWLASDEARDITGLAVPVDGGHMVLPGINGDPVLA